MGDVQQIIQKRIIQVKFTECVILLFQVIIHICLVKAGAPLTYNFTDKNYDQDEWSHLS